MRIVREGYANIMRDGKVIHADVRYLEDDQRRVAVFVEKKAPPANVYSLDDVEVVRLRGCSACRGDTPKQTLARLWVTSERAANAV